MAVRMSFPTPDLGDPFSFHYPIAYGLAIYLGTYPKIRMGINLNLHQDFLVGVKMDGVVRALVHTHIRTHITLLSPTDLISPYANASCLG